MDKYCKWTRVCWQNVSHNHSLRFFESKFIHIVNICKRQISRGRTQSLHLLQRHSTIWLFHCSATLIRIYRPKSSVTKRMDKHHDCINLSHKWKCVNNRISNKTTWLLNITFEERKKIIFIIKSFLSENKQLSSAREGKNIMGVEDI